MMISLLAEIERSQLMLLGGFLLLGWVLMRRLIGRRRRLIQDGQQTDRVLQELRHPKVAAVPLAGAPPDTQRWQVALFDLQRELKGELDSRIAIIQALVRHADERIAELRSLQMPAERASEAVDAPLSGALTGTIRSQIGDLSRSGWAAEEIAAQTGLSIGDVELLLASEPADAPPRGR